MHNLWPDHGPTSTLRRSTLRFAAAMLLTLSVATCTPDRSSSSPRRSSDRSTHAPTRVDTRTHHNPGGGGVGLVWRVE
jgi:hypothetical protein